MRAHIDGSILEVCRATKRGKAAQSVDEAAEKIQNEVSQLADCGRLTMSISTFIFGCCSRQLYRWCSQTAESILTFSVVAKPIYRRSARGYSAKTPAFLVLLKTIHRFHYRGTLLELVEPRGILSTSDYKEWDGRKSEQDADEILGKSRKLWTWRDRGVVLARYKAEAEDGHGSGRSILCASCFDHYAPWAK